MFYQSYLRKSAKPWLFLIFLIHAIHISSGQVNNEIQKRICSAFAIDALSKLEIDGKLDEDVWNKGYWNTEFIQRQPNENQSPSVQTAFKIAFDKKYIYIGIQNFDSEASSISSRMSRRDDLEGDWVEVILDSNHDLRSAFSFAVTAAGVKGDKIISLDGKSEDEFWNPIWYAASHIHREGWSVEMKIPFSQLRFGELKNMDWGLQVRRRYFKNEETSVWQRVPLDASGWISQFGVLQDLENSNVKKLLEIQPYVTSSLNTLKKDIKDPFQSSYSKSIGMGIDGKVGVTNDLVVDFTVNPDFGQVEADPAAIALDGFQLFFAEQRPFFVENKEIYNYQFSTPIIGSRHNNDNLFYSRRIGGKPHGIAHVQDGESVNSPERTTILGAAKFGGKTSNGLSIGILEAITGKEYAEITSGEEVNSVLVEPLTNYFVGRVQQDLNNRNTYIGAILTVANRKLDQNLEQTMHASAMSGGVDWLHQWNNRNYYLGANLVVSRVEGSKEAILNTQISIPHLFQKTDASHVVLDNERTALTGTGGDIKIGKAGSGNFTFETGITWRSPDLELNDVGFMREADVIFNYSGMTYRFLKPFGIFRSAAINYKHWLFTDFGGELNYVDWDVEMTGLFQNNWNAYLGFFSQPHVYSRSFLQGGPRIKLADQYGFWWGMGTDSRKKFRVSYNAWTKTGSEGSYFLLENGLNFTYQPIDKFSFSFIPKYTLINHRLQYIKTLTTVDGNQRFITAKLDQKTLSFALRLNYIITPNLSLQYYGQPFISVGQYNDFNYVQNPLSENQAEQLHFYKSQQITYEEASNAYWVDENRGGKSDYSISNPDFSFAQFQSNLVLRYEYKPGSELFLVWSQGMTDIAAPETRFFDNVNAQLLGASFVNNFLVKLTYRFY
ncbi:MAG: DUF5916 domain-containing protein [Bacteroidota bacterium]